MCSHASIDDKRAYPYYPRFKRELVLGLLATEWYVSGSTNEDEPRWVCTKEPASGITSQYNFSVTCFALRHISLATMQKQRSTTRHAPELLVLVRKRVLCELIL